MNHAIVISMTVPEMIERAKRTEDAGDAGTPPEVQAASLVAGALWRIGAEICARIQAEE